MPPPLHTSPPAARVSAFVPLRSWRRLAARVAAKGGFDARSARLAWGGVKEFVDGSLGSNSALFWEPYLDAAPAAAPGGARDADGDECSRRPAACGTRTVAADELAALVRGAAGAGLQVALHAIGDRGVDEALDALGAAPAGSQQHRVEHAQHLSGPAAAARMAALGLAAVPNPQHLLADRSALARKLGAARAGAGRAYAYGTLAAAGVPLAFGSDWPVVPVDPWASVHAAVHRREPSAPTSGDGDGGARPWEAPSERLALADALLGHTSRAAAAARLSHWVGALRPGLRADFVVVDRDPFGAGGLVGTDGRLPAVLATYMDGACVWGCLDDAAAAAA